MALVVNDRVKETSTTAGTVTFTLDGAVAGFETFSSAIGNSNTTYYAIEIPNSTEFEVGLGTVSAGQLARTQVFSSSNSDALVDFSAGTKNVFCTLPASKAVIEDASNNVTLPADLTVGTDTFDVDSTNEKVNIGTTSGAYTGLNVYKKSGPGNIYVHLNGNPGTIIGTSLLSEGASGDFIINTRDDADIRIYTNNTLRSEFKNNGNFYVDTDTLYVDAVNDRVGIGGIPTERLTVIGPNNSSAATLKVKDTDGRGILISSPYSGSGVGHIGTDGTSSALGFKVNGTEYARFSTNGYFGIGTTNPSSLLHLSSSDPQITITDTDGTGSPVIKADVNDLVLDSPGNIILDAFSNSLIFKDNGQQIGTFANFSGDFGMQSSIADKDIIFRGNDNGFVLTALTLDMSEAGAATFNDKVILGANKSIEFGDSGETITGDGTNLTILSSGYMEVKSAGNLLLDSTGGSIFLRDTTLNLLQVFKSGSIDTILRQPQSDGDLTIRGNDGGSDVDALTFDMSEAGNATFNGDVTVENYLRIDKSGSEVLNIRGETNYGTLSVGNRTLNILGNVIKFEDDTFVERMRMHSNGNIGIGTSSPSSLLHLSSSDPQITITDTDGSGSQIIKAVGDDFTIDAAANITLDVGGANGINLYNDNGPKGRIYFLSDNLNIKPTQSDTDLVIKGNDGGAEITALTLDMSEAGAATFNSSVTVGANLDVSSGTIKLDGNYPTGTNNVAMGDTALDSIGTGGAGHNVAIGHAALTADNTGTGNVGIGAFALTSTVTGNYSTAIGQEALKVNTASWNNAIGFQSMLTSVGGEKNIAMGFWSLKNLGSNDKNVAIGHEAGINLTGGDNNIIIGHNAQAASATTSNQITLGDTNITSLRIPGLASGASSGDVLTYDGTDITLSAPTGVTAGFVIAMSIAL